MPVWPVQADAEAQHDRCRSAASACSLGVECPAANLSRRPGQAAGYLLAMTSEADLDLSLENFPAGSLLAVGQAVLEVSQAPHLGCAKFVERFGVEAMRFVNSRAGRQLRLRGMNARVVVSGTVRLGDMAAKAPRGPDRALPPSPSRSARPHIPVTGRGDPHAPSATAG